MKDDATCFFVMKLSHKNGGVNLLKYHFVTPTTTPSPPTDCRLALNFLSSFPCAECSLIFRIMFVEQGQISMTPTVIVCKLVLHTMTLEKIRAKK